MMDVMPLPRAVAHFNKRWTNRFLEPIARRSPGFAVVHHVGRWSGRSYATPVNLFAGDGCHVVLLTYGPRADWFQNVMAGPATIETRGTNRTIMSIELVDRGAVAGVVPSVVRLATRVLRAHDFARLTLDDDR